MSISAPTFPSAGLLVGSGTSVTSNSFTRDATASILVCVTWVTGGLDAGFSSGISDTFGDMTWTKLAETSIQNSGNPDTVGVVIFGCDVTSSATGTVTVTLPAGGAAFIQRIVDVPGASISSNHGVNSGLNVGSRTLTLGSAPASTSAGFVLYGTWPHQTVTDDAAYTNLGADGGSGGPFGINCAADYSYDLGSPNQSATLSAAATTDTACAIIELTQRPIPPPPPKLHVAPSSAVIQRASSW